MQNPVIYLNPFLRQRIILANKINSLLEKRAMATNMDKAMFIEKVFDYENKKEWDFQGELPCVIDFWAPWCGPCKMVGPVIEELSKEYEGKVNFYKINTDVEQELAGAFGIRSIPSLLFVPKDGQPKMAVGALPKESLKEAVEKELLTVTA